MKHNSKEYKIFDQSIAIEKAQELLDSLKSKNDDIKYVRVDQNTIIGIKPNRENTLAIIQKLKNRPKKTNLIEQIEYGQYI